MFEFSSLEEMASSSDAIVFGRIEQAEPTRVVGGMQFVELMIDVEDALKGPTGVPVIIEVVERLGFQVGDVGYWFLHRKRMLRTASSIGSRIPSRRSS